MVVVWVGGFGLGAGPSEAGCAGEGGGVAGGAIWTGILGSGAGFVTGVLGAGGGVAAAGGDSGA